MTTMKQFEQMIDHIPANILAAAKNDVPDESGVVKNKNPMVVEFAKNLIDQISNSRLTPEEKLVLTTKLSSTLYPTEFPADGKLNTKTGLGLLFTQVLNKQK